MDALVPSQRKAPLTGPTRDTQRQKVYDWGRAYEKKADLTLAECEDLVSWAHVQYDLVWRGQMKDGRGRRRASGSTHSITLPVWSRTSSVVLHEAAHAIVGLRFGPIVAGHGPEFVRVYIELLVRRKLTTMTEARARARTGKLKVSTDPRCIPVPAMRLKSITELRRHIELLQGQLIQAQMKLANLRITQRD